MLCCPTYMKVGVCEWINLGFNSLVDRHSWIQTISGFILNIPMPHTTLIHLGIDPENLFVSQLFNYDDRTGHTSLLQMLHFPLTIMSYHNGISLYTVTEPDAWF